MHCQSLLYHHAHRMHIGSDRSTGLYVPYGKLLLALSKIMLHRRPFTDALFRIYRNLGVGDWCSLSPTVIGEFPFLSPAV